MPYSPIDSKEKQVPGFRRLRGYAFDPSLNLQMDAALINQVTFKVPWEVDSEGNEILKPGPEGEYIKVIDEDEDGNLLHVPVDLDDEQVIAQDGLTPSESSPQFHQQMVYAVAMTTIRNFERALRRRMLWAPDLSRDGSRTVQTYVRQLRIYPHRLREANAYYSPQEKALHFGRFRPKGNGRGGGEIFTCLSHDIIAHQLTHALIDGIHPQFSRAGDDHDNPEELDTLAFHEGFSDLVAYFQHFTFPEAVRHQVAKTRGNLLQENFLLQLAGQFGQAIGGGRAALRDVLRREKDEKGNWVPREPDPEDLNTALEPHARGEILVRAVFGAFFSIYESRIADLRRIASNGTGVLPQGELHPDLVGRLADEAARVAEILLTLCIRALDYCPPRRIGFGDFLRAVITADFDQVPDDERVYRVAIVDSFRRHGIHPANVPTLSVESLLWPVPDAELKVPSVCRKLLQPLARKWNLVNDRREVFDLHQKTRDKLRRWISENRQKIHLPGLDLRKGKRISVTALRPIRRLAPDGQPFLEMLVELRAGGDCAYVVDLESGRIRYWIHREADASGRNPVLEDGRQRPPAFRRLRGYAFDPSLNSGMDTAVINQVTFKVPWEEGPRAEEGTETAGSFRGPVGEYLEVVDHDPASDCFYEPVDLNQKHLLAQDGLPPSEGNPQFHQQMVYGVAMTTIRNFERALGRRALWSPRRWKDERGRRREEYVPRLRIYPHAVREANAFYSPRKKALLFGYFPASVVDSRDHLPGGTVFTCLSHDVIAHEITHALLDGLHPRFAEPSNPDSLAFHEAFADLVALFQHFTFPEVLRHQIARTRGELDRQNLLGQLAQQFGKAIGGHGALRDALGKEDEHGVWKPAAPDPRALDKQLEPHDRGAVLVAAVFDAFLSIYKSRVSDLLRIASNGTGVLPQGELHPDLVNRLAGEAAKSAQHVLTMCIRALDYCPPVDITFGDYLRGLITADFDLVPDDPRGYRIAVIEAFRRRGIYPRDVRTLSLESLRWQAPEEGSGDEEIREILRGLANRWRLTGDRKVISIKARAARQALHEWLSHYQSELKIGLNLQDPDAPFEVHSVRPTRRIGPDGQSIVEMVVEITQYRWEPLIEGRTVDRAAESYDEGFPFRGGCTLLVDIETGRVRYSIVKDITNQNRLRRQRAFLQGGSTASLRATYFSSLTDWEDLDGGEKREPFAMLHRSVEEERS